VMCARSHARPAGFPSKSHGTNAAGTAGTLDISGQERLHHSGNGTLGSYLVLQARTRAGTSARL
jgi:hypothetical protein